MPVTRKGIERATGDTVAYRVRIFAPAALSIGCSTASGAMRKFRANRHVHHSADQMFALVADVERYHEFVPLCQKHAIVSRQNSNDSEILITDMMVAYAIVRETIRSRVTLDRTNGHILVESVDGPLRQLRTLWTFRSSDDDSCDVGFELTYEFANPILAFLAGRVLDAAFSRYVQAFETRADAVYGRRAGPSSQRMDSDARNADADLRTGSLP